MISFGFSAFLKIVSLNDKPQRTELLRRVTPTDDGAYDFHRRMRQLCAQYMTGGKSLAEVLADADSIKGIPERMSARSVIEKLSVWRQNIKGDIVTVAGAKFTSPNSVFEVKYTPNFGVSDSGKVTTFHVWNTKKPQLAAGAACGALSTVLRSYAQTDAPYEVAILSVPDDCQMLASRDYPYRPELMTAIIGRVEQILENPPTTPMSPTIEPPRPPR